MRLEWVDLRMFYPMRILGLVAKLLLITKGYSYCVCVGTFRKIAFSRVLWVGHPEYVLLVTMNGFI